MLAAAVRVHEALDKQRQADADSVQDGHRRRDQAVAILELFLQGLLRELRVALDITRYEEDEHQRRQNPERTVQVWTLRVLRLELAIEGDEAAEDSAAHRL